MTTPLTRRQIELLTEIGDDDTIRMDVFSSLDKTCNADSTDLESLARPTSCWSRPRYVVGNSAPRSPKKSL